jgi:anti-sigma factor RsiW
VKCDLVDSLLQLYFDDELSATGTAEFERHVLYCVDCATELVDLDLLRDRLHLASLYERAPASLRRKINAPFRPSQPVSVASGPRSWRWLAAAAALLLLAILLVRVSPAVHKDDYQADLADEIVDAHIRSLPPGFMTQITSNDERIVTAWFNDRLKFGIPVRDLASEGFALKGARLDILNGRSVAVLVYERSGHPINVFVWPAREPDPSAHVGSRQRFQWVAWQNGKLEFCAISDATRVDLEQLRQLIASSI